MIIVLISTMINNSQDLTVRRLESRKWSEQASPKWLQRSVNRSLANRFSLCCSTILSSPCRDRLRCYARRIGAHPHARHLAPWSVPGGWRKFLSRQRKQRASVSYLPDMGSHAWSLQRSFLVKPYSYPEQQSFYYTLSNVCLVEGGGDLLWLLLCNVFYSGSKKFELSWEKFEQQSNSYILLAP